MSDKKFVEGVRFFERKPNQPDFVLGALLITPEDLNFWMQGNADCVSEYQGKKQVKFQVKKSRDGKIYIDLDTFKPAAAGEKDSLPF